MKALLLVSALLCFSLAHAATDRLLNPQNLYGLDPSLKYPKLYDLSSGEARPVKNASFLPNRVYLVYREESKHWAYVLSNGTGKFPIPLEFLGQGSVVSGTFLGGTYPNEHYKVGAEGKWVRTTEPEYYRFLVLSEPPVIKFVSFNDPVFPAISSGK